MSLSHIVSIVTGGASGLGAATTRSIIQKGGRVIVADLREQYERYQELMMTTKSAAAEFVETNVTKEEQVMMALDVAEQKFGKPVNAAINCAGIVIGEKTIRTTTTTEKDGDNTCVTTPHSLSSFTKSLTVNTVGTFNVARLAAERMIKNSSNNNDVEGGCIINTSSIAAMDGQRGQVAYAASKAAIIGMTLPMARDLASHRIRVMTIAPGLFETPLLEELPDTVKKELSKHVPYPSRLGYPDEFANLVCSILLNPMLNGEVIRLDGALRMPPS